MGKMGSSLQSSMSGQMNPTNMQRQAYGSTSPTSGFSMESANMPMAYGAGGTQTEQNPYMYQLYGSGQPVQMATPGGGYGNFGTMGPMQQQGMGQQQPFDREGAYQALMNSSLGQKFGFALDPNRGIMNPSLGMQSYGVGPYADGATDYQGMAQTASGVGGNAGNTVVEQATQRSGPPGFLIPVSEYFRPGQYTYMNPGVDQRLADALRNDRLVNRGYGFSNRPLTNVQHSFERNATPPSGFAQANVNDMRSFMAREGYLFDPTSNTIYSPETARIRFNY